MTALARGIADEKASNGRRTRARALRREMTEAEAKLWRMLRSRQIGGTSVPPSAAARALHCGFVCHEARLIVKLDGGQHESLSQQEADRTRFLQSEGYRVLRFWNDEVLENAEGVHAMIVENVRQPHPRPTLPLEGEGFELSRITTQERIVLLIRCRLHVY